MVTQKSELFPAHLLYFHKIMNITYLILENPAAPPNTVLGYGFLFCTSSQRHYLEVNCDWPFFFCFFFYSRTRHLAWRTRKGPSSKSSSRTSPSKSNMDNKVPNRSEGNACSQLFLHHWNVLLASLPYCLSCYFLSDYTAVRISHFKETRKRQMFKNQDVLSTWLLSAQICTSNFTTY